MRSTSSLTVNLSAITRNIAALRDTISPGCALCAVVKADGYGLGAARIAQQLAESGVSMLAVYTLGQAEAIAAADITLPMLVLMPIREIESGGPIHRLFLTGRLHLTVHGVSHAQDLCELSERLGGGPLPVHLEVDTGMSRGGARPDEAARTLALIGDDRRLRLAGVFTHFSNSVADGSRTHDQMDEFEQLLERCGEGIPGDAIIHAANSHALTRGKRFHRTMVRVGLAWTGLAQPEDAPEFAARLEPILTWESSIVHVKSVPEAVPVGYGSLFRTHRPTRLGTIPVGYFDGYPLGGASSDGRFVRIVADTPCGERSWDAPVVGAINMDQIVVDLTSCEPSIGYPDGFIGMRAELYGSDRARSNFIPKLAAAVGAHPYELLCRLHPRIPRQFVTESAIESLVPAREIFERGVTEAIAS
ncbi:MAG: alanine racemase [Phycisphaerales bacterium]|nr:alanine racemase [Phycisphaerales bacterium]